ncbi:KRTAP10L11 [Ovibos moschatus]
MASSALSVCSSDLSYGSRVDDCPESCCEPPCCAPSCCTPAPRLTLLCAPVSCESSPCCQPACSSSCPALCCQQSSCQPSCCTSYPCQQILLRVPPLPPRVPPCLLGAHLLLPVQLLPPGLLLQLLPPGLLRVPPLPARVPPPCLLHPRLSHGALLLTWHTLSGPPGCYGPLCPPLLPASGPLQDLTQTCMNMH